MATKECVDYTFLPPAVKEQVRRGEVIELDMLEGGAGTWIKYVDAGIDYLVPSFVAGDVSVFDRHQRLLIDDAQDNRQILMD